MHEILFDIRCDIWYYIREATNETEDITMELKELNELCKELKKLKDEKAEIKKEVGKLEGIIFEKEQIILDTLQAEQLSSFKFENGTVSTSAQVNVKKVDLDAFKQYFRDKGVWEEMADINSQTLKAYIKQEKNKLQEEGVFDFEVPGLEISEIFRINLRSK